MDFDGDGDTDILTGSYSPGDLYLFRRGSDGKFTREILKDRHGKNLQFTASVPFAADWNGDGVLDLIVGDIQGSVHFIQNEGSAKALLFGSPQQLSADGKPIQAGHGDSGPIVADWDGDRVPDLLVGCGDGSVQFYRNLGTPKEAKLAAPRTLVAKSPEGKAWNGELKDLEWGARVKICAVDWNGDGKLDLLLGDRSSVKGTAPNLSESEKAEAEKARKRHAELSAEFSKLHSEGDYPKLAEAYRKETDQAKKAELLKEVQARGQEIQKKAEPLMKEMRELQPLAQKGQAPLRNAGYVFVFLRQTTEVSKAKQ